MSTQSSDPGQYSTRQVDPKVWRSSSIHLPLKIRLWQTLVLTKGLYAVSWEMANQEVEASGTQSGANHKGDKWCSALQSSNSDDGEPATGKTSQMVEATSCLAFRCSYTKSH